MLVVSYICLFCHVNFIITQMHCTCERGSSLNFCMPLQRFDCSSNAIFDLAVLIICCPLHPYVVVCCSSSFFHCCVRLLIIACLAEPGLMESNSYGSRTCTHWFFLSTYCYFFKSKYVKLFFSNWIPLWTNNIECVHFGFANYVYSKEEKVCS